GSGSYTADGGIDFTARGVSDQYGPLGVDVSGSIARPVARIAAARPGFGVGLRNVVATVRGSGNGYAVIADGESDYGALDANVDILAGSRSEEHTSELQSREKLVCRLLLEKKKTTVR